MAAQPRSGSLRPAVVQAAALIRDMAPRLLALLVVCASAVCLPALLLADTPPKPLPPLNIDADGITISELSTASNTNSLGVQESIPSRPGAIGGEDRTGRPQGQRFSFRRQPIGGMEGR